MWEDIQSFAYSLYLFTKSDIKTILIPIVRFFFLWSYLTLIQLHRQFLEP